MIRSALSGDRDRVLLMARAFHAAADLPFAFSAPMASLLFDAALADDDRLCLIYEQDGAAVGVLAAHAAPHMLAPVKAAHEIMWWIDPEYRGQAASRMLAAYEEWAKSRGCVLIHMVGLGSDPITSRLYERHGYRAAERHFMKPLRA
jgi:GNAT superfamily N-acetyltransferase